MVCPSRLLRQGGRFQKGIAARFPQQLVQGASTGAGVPDGEWRDQEPAGPRVAPTGSTWPFIAESAPIAPVLGMALSLSGRLAVSGRGLQGRACFFDQIRAIIGMVSDLLCPLILVSSSTASHLLLAVVAPGASSKVYPALTIFRVSDAGRALVTSTHPGRVCIKPPSL